MKRPFLIVLFFCLSLSNVAQNLESDVDKIGIGDTLKSNIAIKKVYEFVLLVSDGNIDSLKTAISIPFGILDSTFIIEDIDSVVNYINKFFSQFKGKKYKIRSIRKYHSFFSGKNDGECFYFFLRVNKSKKEFEVGVEVDGRRNPKVIFLGRIQRLKYLKGGRNEP